MYCVYHLQSLQHHTQTFSLSEGIACVCFCVHGLTLGGICGRHQAGALCRTGSGLRLC